MTAFVFCPVKTSRITGAFSSSCCVIQRKAQRLQSPQNFLLALCKATVPNGGITFCCVRHLDWLLIESLGVSQKIHPVSIQLQAKCSFSRALPAATVIERSCIPSQLTQGPSIPGCYEPALSPAQKSAGDDQAYFADYRFWTG